jgi:RNA recognition motif-containing protein
MNTQLYIGNLSYSVTQADLENLFAQCGPVEKVALMKDRDTGQPRGFAFVTMATPEGAQAALQKMNGHDLGGRPIKVSEARPREERPPGGGGGGGGYGGGGGGSRRERY